MLTSPRLYSRTPPFFSQGISSARVLRNLLLDISNSLATSHANKIALSMPLSQRTLKRALKRTTRFILRCAFRSRDNCRAQGLTAWFHAPCGPDYAIIHRNSRTFLYQVCINLYSSHLMSSHSHLMSSQIVPKPCEHWLLPLLPLLPLHLI